MQIVLKCGAVAVLSEAATFERIDHPNGSPVWLNVNDKNGKRVAEFPVDSVAGILHTDESNLEPLIKP